MIQPGKRTLLLISCLALALGLLGFPRQAAVSRLPDGLTLPDRVFPATFGGFPAADSRAVAFLVEGFTAGEAVPLVTADGESTLLVVPVTAHHSSYMTVALISGLFFWVMATFVFRQRYARPAVAQFYWVTLLYGLSILVGGVYFQTSRAPLGLVLSLVQLSCLALLPAIFVHLSLVFPVRRSLSAWPARVAGVLYLLATALVLWQAVAYWRCFSRPDQSALQQLAAPNEAGDILIVLQVAAGLLLLGWQERRLDSRRERQQVRWLLMGFLVGATPYVFLRTLPLLLHHQAPLPAYLDRIFEPAIPLAFALTIIRYRFLDIDIILRRGVLYGTLAALLAAIVALPALLVGISWSTPWPFLVKFLPVAGGVAAGLLYLPLRHRLGGWIDRAFFKIKHHLDKLAHDLETGLEATSGACDVVRVLRQAIIEGVDPSPLEIAVIVGDGGATAAGPVAADHPAVNLVTALIASGAREIRAAPQATTSAETEAGDFPAALSEQGIVLAVPLCGEQAVQGAICLGPKKSGYRYVRSDLDFLQTAAELAARRLREIRLVQGLIEERLARRQLDEMGELKDNFLSQVSHDLRTPVTSLGWLLRNMQDGLAGDLNQRQTEYLQTMGQSVTHLEGLVAGLLKISRLEAGESQIVTGPTDLVPVMARAQGTVQPLAAARQVRIDLQTAVELPPVVAQADKLAEVLVNLLTNAVRYSPGGAEVALTAGLAAGRVVVTVGDQGPGLRGLVDPFARFAQGEPSPYVAGGGYGLGLTIAREYMNLMGGSISAADRPAGGAEFRLELVAAPQH